MKNKEYIEKLIYRTEHYPNGKTDEEIKKLYKEVQNVFNSDEYSYEEKQLLKKKGFIEALTMMHDGIE